MDILGLRILALVVPAIHRFGKEWRYSFTSLPVTLECSVIRYPKYGPEWFVTVSAEVLSAVVPAFETEFVSCG